jgi:hypothetical protein
MYKPAKIKVKLIRILHNYLLFAGLYLIGFNSYSQEQSDFGKAINESGNTNFNPLVIIDSLQARGYLEASFTTQTTDSIKSYLFHNGLRYKWGALTTRKNGFLTPIEVIREQINQPADRIHLQKTVNNYLEIVAHNNGFPFAEANLTIDSISNSEVFASVEINLKNEITYDSIIIRSNTAIINKGYLQRFLKMPVGALFSTEAYISIPEKLKQLPFLRLTGPPLLAFSNNQCQITLEIENIATSQLDAFIGFIPEQNRTNFTGQIDVSFQNLFKRGINWQLNWQKYSANSQFLNTTLSQSAAFKSPLGLQLQFGLLQEDSTFLQNDYQIGIFYPFKGNFSLGVGYKGFLNNIIREFDSTEISSLREPFRSSQLNAVSIIASWRDVITYPALKNDYYLLGNISIGLKKIRNFNNLPEIWKNVPESSTNYSAKIQVGAQKKVLKRFLLEQRLEFSFIENQALSRNDFLRLGGLQDLRGFDRNFFYTSYYGLITMNYRYFLDNNSSFFLLTDFATMEKEVGEVYTFGAGLDVKTKNGWFRLIYAVGNRLNESVNFSTAKVHFGYIALF